MVLVYQTNKCEDQQADILQKINIVVCVSKTLHKTRLFNIINQCFWVPLCNPNCTVNCQATTMLCYDFPRYNFHQVWPTLEKQVGKHYSMYSPRWLNSSTCFSLQDWPGDMNCAVSSLCARWLAFYQPIPVQAIAVWQPKVLV